jgi:outer membrane protein OmpA-like peptidoglycan-associated protein
MGRLSTLFRICAGCLIAALWCSAARAQSAPGETRITHPNGAAVVVRGLTARDDSIVLTATISNPGERELRLNRFRSFVLEGGGRALHHLNAPLGNPDLTMPPRSRTAAELVFVGPLAPAARELRLTTNQGVGTTDNPYDDAPVLRATLPVGAAAGTSAVNQASHPDGATLRVRRVVASGGSCLASVLATNGYDRTIVLNHAGGLVLTDERGGTATLKAPAENRELVVPPSTRIDAELVFDCRQSDTGGPLTLHTNRGTPGTTDNPYDTLPVFALRVQAESAAEGSGIPAASRASVTPIARSQLTSEPRVAAAPVSAARTAEASAAAQPSAQPAPSPSRSPPAPPTAASPPRASAVERPPRLPAPRTPEELQASLRAEKTDRGLRLVVPSDTLFEPTGKTLRGEADQKLQDIVALMAAEKAREVVVIAHTDGMGSDDDNLALSEERARTVAGWLKAHAAKPSPRFVERFHGRTRPVAPNRNAEGEDNPEGRAQNRRIEILLRRR